MASNYGIGNLDDPEALGNGGVVAVLKRLRTLLGGVGQVLADVTDRAGRLLGIATLGAAENHIGQVAVGAALVPQTPAITAGAYSAKDAVGGLLTFAGAARAAGKISCIESVVVTDLAMQNAELVLVLFDRTFTAMVDNAPWDPSDADMANCQGHISIGAGKYLSFTDNSEATITDQPLHVKPNATSLFGQMYCIGTPTYASVADLTVKIAFRHVS